MMVRFTQRDASLVRLGEIAMILELHRQGVSVSAIARQVGLDRKTVHKLHRAWPGAADVWSACAAGEQDRAVHALSARAACGVSAVERATSASRAARTWLHWRL